MNPPGGIPAWDDEPAELQRLGAAEAITATIDPTRMLGALGHALGRRALHPASLLRALTQHTQRLTMAGAATAARAVGMDVAGPGQADQRDRRFQDVAWSENPAFYGLLQAYLLNRQLLEELVEGAELDGVRMAKARFAARLVNDALAPTNFLPTNPAALRRAAETGGRSMLRGVRNMVEDLVTNGGWPKQVDLSPFKVGSNLAATPGQVVFRNDLIELIQYEAATEETREIPLLFCPPWINKYYIMDLAPGKSLAEWAVNHGLTTFAISYRNPDASMRDVGFDEYLLHGPRAALDAVMDITGSPTVNTLSVCLGGTLTSALLAYLKATGEASIVNSSTVLNCLVDHAGAGTLSEVFTDEAAIASLEHRMAEQGFLEAGDMAHTFDLLRANDLVFSYVASGWLCGEQPPAFDLLAWNQDSTRMPAKMHSFYLRQCWLENALAEDRMVLCGESLQVSGIEVDSYIVAAVDDHIVPWRSSYRTTQILKGACRFVLSSSGHIAGIVNPPGPKPRLWTNDRLPTDPDEWRREATEHKDTWWNDWVEWIVPRSGSLQAPPRTGSPRHPVLGPAPGTYVHG